MKGSELALAAAKIASLKPAFDECLSSELVKWLRANVMKGITIKELRDIHGMGEAAAIQWYWRQQPRSALFTTAKKLDPNNQELKTCSADELLRHLVSLMEGKTEPAVNPQRQKSRARVAKRPVLEILRLPNPLQRRMELEKLSPTELKSAVRSLGLGWATLSTKPTKRELIEHILALGIASHDGSETRSLADESRY